MKKEFCEWLDNILGGGDIPKEAIAANFNLYEDTDKQWSAEIVLTSRFDEDDQDWACDEVTDLGSRENLFSFEFEGEWDAVLEMYVNAVEEYLVDGKYADKLKTFVAVGVGFVDGDIEIVYKK